jgi:hypothetical protein
MMVIAYICPAVLASKYNQGAVVKYASLAHRSVLLAMFSRKRAKASPF